MITIYTDGACLDNPGPGGWAAVIVDGEEKLEIKGHQEMTTNNRMEIVAAIEALARTPEGAEVTIQADSQYLVNSMTRNWKRKANLDLWERLDGLVASRQVNWVWMRGHVGHPENERADELANEMAGIKGEVVGQGKLTHLDSLGRARMVDVTEKPETEREAVARGVVVTQPATLDLIKQGRMAKGEVLSVARLAGIMAAKKTPHLIPLCHPILLTDVTVEFSFDEEHSAVEITATARSTGRTGVEMEALTAVAVSALTIYDMCKAVDRGMRIEGIRLVRKSGGKSGTIILD